MENEVFLSGYCRQIDQSRRVLVEQFDGQMDVDCGYFTCPYASNCTIAQQIKSTVQSRS